MTTIIRQPLHFFNLGIWRASYTYEGMRNVETTQTSAGLFTLRKSIERSHPFGALVGRELINILEIQMKLNMGLIDRLVRVALAATVGVLWYLGKIDGTAAIILGVLAAVFVLTSLVGFCPLYAPFKLSTRKSK